MDQCELALRVVSALHSDSFVVGAARVTCSKPVYIRPEWPVVDLIPFTPLTDPNHHSGAAFMLVSSVHI